MPQVLYEIEKKNLFIITEKINIEKQKDFFISELTEMLYRYKDVLFSSNHIDCLFSEFEGLIMDIEQDSEDIISVTFLLKAAPHFFKRYTKYRGNVKFKDMDNRNLFSMFLKVDFSIENDKYTLLEVYSSDIHEHFQTKNITTLNFENIYFELFLEKFKNEIEVDIKIKSEPLVSFKYSSKEIEVDFSNSSVVRTDAELKKIDTTVKRIFGVTQKRIFSNEDAFKIYYKI